MIELQFLNKLLATKDYAVITYNEITEDYFTAYKEHFAFIKRHFDKYNIVPDTISVIDKFSNFDIVEVSEPFDYLVSKLQEQYSYTTLVPHMKKLEQFITNGEADKAWEYWVSVGNDHNFIKNTNAVDIIDDAQNRFNEYLIKSRDISKYYKKTGLKELDEITGGWDAKEEFALVAARTNIGKTWWLILFALYQAKQGESVGFISIEMGVNKIAMRMDTFASHISNWGISKAVLGVQPEYEAYIKNIKEEIPGTFKVLTSQNIVGNFTPTKIRAFVEREKISILFVDQFSLLADDKNAKGVTESYMNISKDLKLIQTKLMIPIIVAAQLNRLENEKDEDTPGPRNIAGTDQVARDATTILFLWKKDEHFVLMVGKHREARVGDKLTYAWDIDKGKLEYIPVGSDPIQRKIKDQKEPSQEAISQDMRARKGDAFS